MKNNLLALFGFFCLATPAAAQDQLLRTLAELERGFWDAHVRNDRAFFEANLADDSVMISAEGVILGKDAVIDAVFSCDSGDFEIDDWALHRVRDDVAIITFEGEYELTCNETRFDLEVVASSTYALRGGRWLNVAYQETVVEDD